MKKQYIDLEYMFYGRPYTYTVDDHTKYAIKFFEEEYGLTTRMVEKLDRDFDLIYSLQDNQQYLGILSKVFYEDAVKEYQEEYLKGDK